jgi:glycosyltransferase involved in cell wall biosynthesis
MSSSETTLQIDLVLLGTRSEIDHTLWPLGNIWTTQVTPAAVQRIVREHLPNSTAKAWLFWDIGLNLPSTDQIVGLLDSPADVWDAGLHLGMGGLPGLLDFVSPTWMLNRNPDADIEATSWRLTLRACLVRTRVLRELGALHSEFRSLEGAALEMGHRYITRGALIRHIPTLITNGENTCIQRVPMEDEVRFIYDRYGQRWSAWAMARAMLSGYVSPLQAARAWRTVVRLPRPSEPNPLSCEGQPLLARDTVEDGRVSVLIPTLERYPYLRTLLGQLRTQTISPYEIIIVDQTPQKRRDTSIQGDYADLPLKVLYLDEAGQCSSRNSGLHMAGGDFVLFLDDDDEVPSTLLEHHLHVLARPEVGVSAGVAEEVGAGPLPSNFRDGRVSDVFPTNNTMIRRSILNASGLFDLAYDRGQRADGDLGMRVYLSGALMVLDPRISVLHHHAPRGGLRAHKARVITYAGSRNSLRQRHLPSTTEIYLAMRYFTPRQVREMLWLRVFGTFSVRGGRGKKFIKILLALFYLPDTLWQVRKRCQEASVMLQRFPQIPRLAPTIAHEAEIIC